MVICNGYNAYKRCIRRNGHYINFNKDLERSLILIAGIPAYIPQDSISDLTKLMAPITEPSFMVIPGNITQLHPI